MEIYYDSSLKENEKLPQKQLKAVRGFIHTWVLDLKTSGLDLQILTPACTGAGPFSIHLNKADAAGLEGQLDRDLPLEGQDVTAYFYARKMIAISVQPPPQQQGKV